MSGRITEEERKVTECWIKFWKELGFDVGFVDPRIMAKVKLEDIRRVESPVEWFPIECYSQTCEILKNITKKNKTPIGPAKFLASVSKLKDLGSIKVCLFQDNSKWVALVAIQDIQRTISFINSGDGWDRVCQFAVEPTPSS